MDEALQTVELIRERVEPVLTDWNLVKRAARQKARGGPSFAGCFCVAAAQQLGVPLWTGDPEILDAAVAAEVEVRDLRP